MRRFAFCRLRFPQNFPFTARKRVVFFCFRIHWGYNTTPGENVRKKAFKLIPCAHLRKFIIQINSNLKIIVMARDWTIRNNNAGNVLKTQAITIDGGDAIGAFSGTPNANIAILNVVNLGAGASTLDVDASKSMIGDQIQLLVETNGAAVITLGGDFAAGVLNLDGVGAYIFLFNGTSFFATATPE